MVDQILFKGFFVAISCRLVVINVDLFTDLDVLKNFLVEVGVYFVGPALLLTVALEQEHQGKVFSLLVDFVVVLSTIFGVEPHWMYHLWLVVQIVVVLHLVVSLTIE